MAGGVAAPPPPTSVSGVVCGSWADTCRRVFLISDGRVVCVCVGREADRGWCVRPAFPSRRGRRGVIKWVLRGGRDVETNLEVRVR